RVAPLGSQPLQPGIERLIELNQRIAGDDIFQNAEKNPGTADQQYGCGQKGRRLRSGWIEQREDDARGRSPLAACAFDGAIAQQLDTRPAMAERKSDELGD